jgi:hypothetical protein
LPPPLQALVALNSMLEKEAGAATVRNCHNLSSAILPTVGCWLLMCEGETKGWFVQFEYLGGVTLAKRLLEGSCFLT